MGKDSGKGNAQIEVNKAEIEVLKDSFHQMENENHNDHQRLFTTLDKISNRLTKIEERLVVEREKDRVILNIRMWLIAIIVSATTYAITWFSSK